MAETDAAADQPLNAHQREEVRRYLATGDADPLHASWGGEVMEAGRRANGALRGALLTEVRSRAAGRRAPRVPPSLDLVRFTSAKVEPMVRGLIPEVERGAVLAVLEQSVVFVTRESLEPLIRSSPYLSTAWQAANLYLESVGADLLGEEAPVIVGFSEGTRCYVSTDYFRRGGNRFADFVLHEVAHIFHNCKRRTVGLAERGRREWLLEIDEIRDGLGGAAERDGVLEADGPQGLAEELRGTIESVVEEGLDTAIEQLDAASALTVDDVARRAGERAEDERATRRLAARIGPRVAEILDGGTEPRPPRCLRRARRLH